MLDGGWLKSHPLPADKSSFGAFEALAQENKEIIKSILESTSSVSPTDDRILTKLRDFYGSCLNEDRLNDVGAAPLLHLVKTLKLLYSGNSTSITSNVQSDEDKIKGLTAAVAFLHSRGILFFFCACIFVHFSCVSGIPALFTFDIEGDVGVDPNHMVLWFSQPELGLPSKASEESISLFPNSNQMFRNTSKRNRSAIFMQKFWNDCSLHLSKKMKYNSKRCVHPS
jgi:endothelin-converting enzyme